MATKLPPLLEPYTRLPPETSLILLTSVLGANTNWLLLRYLSSHLAGAPRTSDESAGEPAETSVVLVSFLRDYAFWKDAAGRLGLDLDALARKKRFVFVDGLTGLFGSSTVSDLKGGVAGSKTLRSTKLKDIRHSLREAVSGIQAGQASTGPANVVLVIDQLDLLLAAAGGSEDISGGSLRDLVADLREHVHSMILTISADEPLISTQITSLERAHASFALSLAHEASLVVSLRLLDTGTAKDVSGVVRITRGGGMEHDEALEERELLYFIAGDGSARVFERGQ